MRKTQQALLDLASSCLLLVDVQERLAPFVHEASTLIENCQWLLRLANTLQVPVIVSEQYPKGLGATIPELQTFCKEALHFEKVYFSCAEDKVGMQLIKDTTRQQIVIIGIEAHVCVLQTALDLLAKDYQVYVVADAISARHRDDTELALARMRQLGVQIISQEMVLFEWAHRAGTEIFKKLQKTFLLKEN